MIRRAIPGALMQALMTIEEQPWHLEIGHFYFGITHC